MRILCLVVAAIGLHWSLPGAQAAELRCGAAAVDVTPQKLPVIRNGSFLEAQDSRILDPLHARCIVLDDSQQRLAIVVVDSCMIPVDVCDRAKQLAHDATGIQIDRIMISATHTHSAPSVMDYCLGSRADDTYRDYLPSRIADSIRLATQRLQPAQLGWSLVDASSHTKCRRWITRSDKLLVDPFGEATVNAMMHPGHQNPDFTGPSGPTDPWLSVLMIRSMQDEPIALLANLSMHYFSGHAGISADYYGRFARQISQHLAPDNDRFVGIMSQGTSGDLWWGDYDRPKDNKPFQDIDQFTRELVALTLKAIEAVPLRSDITLGMAERRLTLERRLPDEQRLAWARRLNRIRGDRRPKDRPEVYALQAIYLHENPTDEVVLQSIQIGDLAITGMPNEVYALTGLKLRAHSPFATTFNISLANGACGYIPPPEQHALGGYTTWPARTAGLEVPAEPKIVENVLQMLEELADRPRRVYREAETVYAKQILKSSPYAFWRFAEMQGPSLGDSTDNDRQLHCTGRVAFHLPGRQGPFGSQHNTHSIHLAGGRLVADGLELGESYSVELSFWLGTPTDFRGETATLISRGKDRLSITGTEGQAAGRLAFGNHEGHTVIQPRTWQHIVFVRNGDFVQVYLNGNAKPEISQKVPSTRALPNRLTLGGDAQRGASLEGKIDEASVYERALTRREIMEHFAAAGLKLDDSSAANGLDSLPLAPADSMRQIHVRDNFRVELVASEPLVQDPVALDWGPDGRLWVAEMADYPMGMDNKGKPGGRIRWLEDTDRDGTYDKSVVFMKDVGFPNGVMAWRNGVIVTAAPEIFYAEDRDGDGVADRKQSLFTGFVTGNQQLRVNGLRWGLDNWIHCASGAHHAGFGSSTFILSVIHDRRSRLGSRDFRFRPDTGQLDPQSGPSQYGRVRDDWGNWFGVQNSQPLWHYVLADQYTRRNPHVPAIDPRQQIRVPRMPRVYSAKPPQRRFHGFDHAGHYTSACGISIYRDDVLFARAEMHAFTCEPFHNLVQHHVMKPSGTSFRGERADDGPIDFFASSDRWTRPVMTRTGPDGALWIVDMYRYMIEHPEWLPAEGRDELRPGYRAGEGLGRIYRVVSESKPCREPVLLVGKSPQQLADLLGHENGIIRDLAHRLILTSDDKADVSRVKQIALEHPLPEARIQALAVLDGLDQSDLPTLLKSLNDAHPSVRRQAICLAESLGSSSADLRSAVLKLVDDTDPQVRHQLACTLGEWNHPEAGYALAQLAVRADNDPFTVAAINSAADRHYTQLVDAAIQAPDQIADSVFNALLLTTQSRRDELSRLLSSNLTTGTQWEPSRIARLTAWLDLLRDKNRQLTSFQTDPGDELSQTIEQVLVLIAKARLIAIDDGADPAVRASAVTLLGREAEQSDEDLSLLATLVAPHLPKPIQMAAIRALARIADPRVADALVEQWSELLPEVRARATETLLSRTEWTHTLLEALRDGEVTSADIDLTHRQRLLTSRDASIANAAKQLLDDPQTDQRSQVVRQYESATVMIGQKDRGRMLFDEHCKTCHAIDNSQQLVGPDLRALTNRSPRALLSAILDPSQAIDPRYQNFNVILQSGEVLVGLVSTENSNSIEIVDAEGKRRVILRDSIDLIQRAPLSLMPVGFEQKIKPPEMNDLIAFLMDLGSDN